MTEWTTVTIKEAGKNRPAYYDQFDCFYGLFREGLIEWLAANCTAGFTVELPVIKFESQSDAAFFLLQSPQEEIHRVAQRRARAQQMKDLLESCKRILAEINNLS